jgi:hypothetical protein
MLWTTCKIRFGLLETEFFIVTTIEIAQVFKITTKAKLHEEIYKTMVHFLSKNSHSYFNWLCCGYMVNKFAAGTPIDPKATCLWVR